MKHDETVARGPFKQLDEDEGGRPSNTDDGQPNAFGNDGNGEEMDPGGKDKGNGGGTNASQRGGSWCDKEGCKANGREYMTKYF